MESLRVDSTRGISTDVLVVLFGYRQRKENYRFMFGLYLQNAHLISETCAIIIYTYIYIYIDANMQEVQTLQAPLTMSPNVISNPPSSIYRMCTN